MLCLRCLASSCIHFSLSKPLRAPFEDFAKLYFVRSFLCLYYLSFCYVHNTWLRLLDRTVLCLRRLASSCIHFSLSKPLRAPFEDFAKLYFVRSFLCLYYFVVFLLCPLCLEWEFHSSHTALTHIRHFLHHFLRLRELFEK